MCLSPRSTTPNWHAVFYREPGSGRTAVCLVNAFGWFRSSREGPGIPAGTAPPACAGVTIELDAGHGDVARAFDAVTGAPLTAKTIDRRTVFDVPDFPVMSCVVIE
ncbi:MAG: hypothetical protein IT577_14580 [Verrucomicrobiae bacterium]|nr:hypothetical protein [Verrucomicrobiae bacterium]